MSISSSDSTMSISSSPAVGANKVFGFLGAWIGSIIVGLVLATVLGVMLYVIKSSEIQESGKIGPLVSLFVATLFALAPLLACFVQTISLDRRSKKLDGMIMSKIKSTQYFQIAKSTLASVQPASVSQPDFVVPMVLFAIIIVFCSLISFMGLFWQNDFAPKSALLGGLYVLGDGITASDIETYQSGTLVVSAVAFVGAYLALFNRLLNQINNNDIYPISFHYFSVWLITAMVLAAVMRHFAVVFGVTDNAVLLGIALAIGAVPAPFFSAFIHWAFGKLNISGDKDDPSRSSMPTNLNLLMIDGLANEKIDRLAELEISDAQVLSCQNPFLLWVRLPYDLGLIVDWIAQAQLYVCLREDGFRKARSLQIGDIHKFVSVLSDSNAAPDLCAELGLKTSYVAPLLASLNDNPCFVRLREVVQAMLPDPSDRHDVALDAGPGGSAPPVVQIPTPATSTQMETAQPTG
jgi:hypothetical protein